jgi:hypothetical protein
MLARPQKLPKGRSDEPIANWKALEQTLRVCLRAYFKMNESKRAVFEAAWIALGSGADRFLDYFETTLSRQTLCGPR